LSVLFRQSKGARLFSSFRKDYEANDITMNKLDRVKASPSLGGGKSRKARSDLTRLFQAFRPHPWHGLESGEEVPHIVNVFVEITAFDLVKYEVDKVSGYLKVDRVQRTSSHPPALYGFIPRTLCADAVGALSPKAEKGDMDPLDICVISERPISKSEVIVRARPVGGLQMLDGGEADDKIISVLHNDHVWGHVRELRDLPGVLLERLRHYFETYKIAPDQSPSSRILRAYGKTHACKVITAAIKDYNTVFAINLRQRKR